MVADLVDRVVQVVQGIGDPLHGRVVREIGRGLHRQAGLEKAVHHLDG